MSDLTAFREKMVVVLAARKERKAAAKLHEQQMQQAAKAEAGKKRKADAQAAKAKKAKPAKKHNPRVFFGESRKAPRRHVFLVSQLCHVSLVSRTHPPALPVRWATPC